MSRDLIDRNAPKPWAIVVAVLVAAALGSVSVPVQVVLARQSQGASQRQVAHNEDVIRQGNRDLCEQVNLALTALHRLPVPCPSVEP